MADDKIRENCFAFANDVYNIKIGNLYYLLSKCGKNKGYITSELGKYYINNISCFVYDSYICSLEFILRHLDKIDDIKYFIYGDLNYNTELFSVKKIYTTEQFKNIISLV